MRRKRLEILQWTGLLAGALVWAGKATWGTVFGALAALHLCLTFLLDQR